MGGGACGTFHRIRAVVSRGEIWWAESPRGGRRPYLVLTRQAAIPVLHNLLCVPTTRTVRGIPTEVQIDETDGMPEPCALTLDNVTLIPREFLRERITRLRGDRMVDVCEALSRAVECTTRAGSI